MKGKREWGGLERCGTSWRSGLETTGIEVHRADGGLAIISTVFDNRSSEWKKRLHVVATEDANNIAKTVSHIITMRALGQ